jgi:Fe-S cluster assembly protein SufD
MSNAVDKKNRESYLADLARMDGLNSPDWMRALREGGAALFGETPFPHRKQEEWRFTNVSPIVQVPFRSLLDGAVAAPSKDVIAEHLYGEPEWNQLVFVDGRYSSELSSLVSGPDGLQVGSLGAAIADDNEVVRKYLGKSGPQSNAFTSLNMAFLQDGAFIHVPDNLAMETPVHFLFVSTGADSLAAYPRNLFVVGRSSECTVLESYVGLTDTGPCLNNAVTEIVLEDNARMDRHKLVAEGAEGFHLATASVLQGRDTSFTSFNITLSGKIVRNELDLTFNGEGSACDLNGLYLNDGDRLIDNALRVRHAAGKCRSRMAYKGVLSDSSKSVFAGKVAVDRGAQRTDSDQINSNLLLSDGATIDTKPQLEIFADDVKCTHGATVGAFPPELIFYFQSRGIDPARAHGILTYGFAAEVVDAIKVGPLHDKLDAYVFDKYCPER